jgi:hypothetical protein
MLIKLFYFFIIMLLFGVSSILTIILGEYFAKKNENGKFAKWWRRNVITQMPDDYED